MVAVPLSVAVMASEPTVCELLTVNVVGERTAVIIVLPVTPPPEIVWPKNTEPVTEDTVRVVPEIAPVNEALEDVGKLGGSAIGGRGIVNWVGLRVSGGTHTPF